MTLLKKKRVNTLSKEKHSLQRFLMKLHGVEK